MATARPATRCCCPAAAALLLLTKVCIWAEVPVMVEALAAQRDLEVEPVGAHRQAGATWHISVGWG
jgi:hypothetical protein